MTELKIQILIIIRLVNIRSKSLWRNQMNKDFQKQVLEEHFKQNQKLDPFVFVTPEVTQFINLMSMVMTGKFIASFLASDLVVAPLQTVVTSLQLSVAKHKDIFLSPEARTKQLAKLNTQMTVHDKRKFELMIRAGGKTIPYVAPVYGGYRQAYEGIKSQGLRGFYKGLSCRLTAAFFHFYPLFNYSLLIDEADVKKGALYQNLKLCGYFLLIDLFINPAYLLENRFILQNRLPEFRTIHNTYRSLEKLLRYGEGFKGIGYHFINNGIGFFTRIPLYLSMLAGEGIAPLMYAPYLIGELITYPFSTAYKRLQCQTAKNVGMIPIRYSGLFHALRVMVYEQGVKGLWRGFPLHLGLNLTKLKFIELFTKRNTIKE